MMQSAFEGVKLDSPVILLVEDESMVREITGQVLSHAGYRVLASASPKQALEVADAHDGKIDLLLTDVVMPEMNGADLATHLLSRRPDLVPVFMSGYAEHDVLKKFKATAIHIHKPFTIDALLAQIAEALHRGREKVTALPAPSL
jgi:DNA-binding NtrC family response regulator